MKEKVSPLVALMAIGCFLTPLLGGKLSTEQVFLQSDALAELFDGDALPILQHTLLALPFLIALAVLLARRRVLQVPSRTISVLFIGFFGIIAATFPAATFKGASFPVLLQWAAYAAALYAVVAGAGRRSGPKAILISIFAGCAGASLRGIVEFGQMKAADPNWRIFGGWMNGNALGAMLLVGIFIGIGLAITETGILKLLAGLFIFTQLVAVVLTNSRGTFLMIPLGVVLFGVLMYAWSGQRAQKLGRAASGLLVGLVAFCCIAAPIAQVVAPVKDDVQLTASQSGLGRLTGSGLSTDQSAYFRRLLWKGVLPIVEEWPSGAGIGNYRFYSAKSGLTTQTQLAHEGYLQLAVDATILAPAFLALALLVWATHVARAPHALPREQNILRAATVTAVFTILAHNLIDSDFYYFGIGLIAFTLIGVSLLLSADAVAPELVPVGIRRFGVGAIALLALGLIFTGYVELIQGRTRFEYAQGDQAGANGDAQTLVSIAPYDFNSWDLAARTASSRPEAMTDLQTAVKLGPNTRVLRTLARLQEGQGNPGAAVTTLNTALELDPNNLVTLHQLLVLEEKTNDEEATRVAERLLAVEHTLYYKIRSLPELVPTETFEARQFLAGQAKTPEQRIELLMPALTGYVEYSKRTLYMVMNLGSSGDFAGESLPSAIEKIKTGVEVAGQIQRAAAAAGDRTAEAAAVKGAADLAAALAKAGSASK